MFNMANLKAHILNKHGKMVPGAFITYKSVEVAQCTFCCYLYKAIICIYIIHSIFEPASTQNHIDKLHICRTNRKGTKDLIKELVDTVVTIAQVCAIIRTGLRAISIKSTF